MPTSVLLAVLVAAGLLALAPALVRRHDVTERQLAERLTSTARVLPRQRRRRSVPGRRPVNPSRVTAPRLRRAAPDTGEFDESDDEDDRAERSAGRERGSSRTGSGRAGPDHRTGRSRSGRSGYDRSGGDRVGRSGRSRSRPGRPVDPRQAVLQRRRRILAALVLLNLVKLLGVAVVGPGFWVGFAVTATLLVTYVVHLRNMALADRRRRRREARRAAIIAAQQAEIRRLQEERAQLRREAARRMAEQREAARRAAAEGMAPPSLSYPPRVVGDERGRRVG